MYGRCCRRGCRCAGAFHSLRWRRSHTYTAPMGKPLLKQCIILLCNYVWMYGCVILSVDNSEYKYMEIIYVTILCTVSAVLKRKKFSSLQKHYNSKFCSTGSISYTKYCLLPLCRFYALRRRIIYMYMYIMYTCEAPSQSLLGELNKMHFKKVK